MVTAQIATIPDREQLLAKVIDSLLPQVDQLNIMLNNYRFTPSFCYKPKITVYERANEKGDAEKFYGLANIEGYIFTCDDDLLYPPDYVETMTKKLQEYANQVILTNHGRIMEPKPVSNSYTDRKGGIRNPLSKFHCLQDAPMEEYLDIGGTGVMAWHSDYFYVDYNRITKKNMADIWIHGFAKEQNCKILHNPHKEGWIQYLNPHHTIWDDHFPHPEEQTALYNSF